MTGGLLVALALTGALAAQQRIPLDSGPPSWMDDYELAAVSVNPPVDARWKEARPDLRRWEELIRNVRNPESHVTIAMVGKYVDLTEAYKSLNEALAHAGFPIGAKVDIEYIDSEKFEDPHVLANADGILVPHGFGGRGAEGKMNQVAQD